MAPTRSEEEIKQIIETHFLNMGFGQKQLEQIALGLRYLSVDEVMEFATPVNTAAMMERIRTEFELEYGVLRNPAETTIQHLDAPPVKFDLVDIYVPVFTLEQIRILKDGYLKKYPEDLMMLCANPIFSVEQMEEILDGIGQGLSFNQIALYAKEPFNELYMNELKEGLVAGLSMEVVALLATLKEVEKRMISLEE